MKRIMFVCKKNSARSQMAEGFARQLTSDCDLITSSGLEASTVHPAAITAMETIGIDIRNQASKSLSDFQPEDFDIVISLCGCGAQLPVQWRSHPGLEDWHLDDPAEQPDIFPRVRDEIKARVASLFNRF